MVGPIIIVLLFATHPAVSGGFARICNCEAAPGALGETCDGNVKFNVFPVCPGFVNGLGCVQSVSPSKTVPVSVQPLLSVTTTV